MQVKEEAVTGSDEALTLMGRGEQDIQYEGRRPWRVKARSLF